MTIPEHFEKRSLLLLVAGAKGAIGSTLAVAASALRAGDASVSGSLATQDKFVEIFPAEGSRGIFTEVCPWDGNVNEIGGYFE